MQTAPPGGEPQLVLLALVQNGFHTVIESVPGCGYRKLNPIFRALLPALCNNVTFLLSFLRMLTPITEEQLDIVDSVTTRPR